MLKKINLSIRSIQYSPPGVDDAPLRVEQLVTARLRENESEVSLSYREPPAEGEQNGGADIQIYFAKSAPSTVSLTCSGTQRYTLVFCQGQPYTGEYSLCGINFDLRVQTHRLKNTLLLDGRLHMEYTIEVGGEPNGKRIITLTILPDNIKMPIREYETGQK